MIRSAVLIVLICALMVPWSAAAQLVDERSIARDVYVGRWSGASGSATVRGESIGASGEVFEAAALRWNATGELPFGIDAADPRRDSDPVASVRVSEDGITWSQWTALTIDGDVTDRSESRFATGIAHFGGAERYLQIAFDRPVDRLTVTMFPPVRPRDDARALVSQPATGESYRFGNVEVRARSEWGCPDGEGARWTPAYTTVTHAVVHHTAGANSVPDWDAELRNIWYLHTVTNGWGDIGYNYLIDPNGVVYEGRAGGNAAIGAHFSCRNTNTAGVSLLGTYTSVAPTAAALASLRRVLAEIARKNGIDPTATALHVPSALLVPTIMGHRDGNSSKLTCTVTTCPGDVLYAMLPAIRTDVACAPAITADPGSTAIRAGSSAMLTVSATGEALTYQWYSGTTGQTNTPIADATGASVTVTPSETAAYWVRVTNACGSVDSAIAVVNLVGGARVRPVRR